MLKICGCNNYFQFGQKSNNKDASGNGYISPPMLSGLDVESITSFSSYMDHSVVIFSNGTIYGSGYNKDNRIINSLPKEILSDFNKFEIKGSSTHLWHPISAVCGSWYTIYLVSAARESKEHQIVYSHSNLETRSPLFLNIGHSNPISLFGGRSNASAINDDGSILFLPESVLMSPTTLIEPIFLPGSEKAVSVACLDMLIVALSLSGRVYFSRVEKVEKESKDKNAEEEEDQESFLAVLNVLNFVTIDSILNGIKIVDLNGTFHHCIAVSEDGRAFGCCSNNFGELGMCEEIDDYENFVEISSLKNFKIKSAFCGANHSLFLTFDGKVLACGNCCCGELFSKDATDENFFLPFETGIEKGATFCVTGSAISAVFIDKDPLNSPNRRVPNKEPSLSSKLETAEAEIIKLKREISKLQSENESLRARGKINDPKEIHIFQKNTSKDLQIVDQKMINQLNIIESIGRGSDSQVFKISTQQNLALKVLNINKKSSTSNPFSQWKRFFQEYEILHNLNHPNIVSSFGFCFGDEEHSPSILLQFCPRNLNDVVDKMDDVQRVCSIFEISSGMEAVHSANLIHRDLKPANILIDEFGHIRISDFGVSCIVDVESQTSSMTAGVGTLKFMAPEILNESTKYNNKVDVYSFGVVAFFILSAGKMPKITMADQAKGKKPEMPDHLNEMAKFLIDACLQFKPEERPSFEQIVDFIKSNNFMLIDGVEKEMEKIKTFLSI